MKKKEKQAGNFKLGDRIAGENNGPFLVKSIRGGKIRLYSINGKVTLRGEYEPDTLENLGYKTI